MALGHILKQAREKRAETPSQVAATTRMKVQIVEALENEDFSKIPAPIYGKGFIKLYAEHVGVDPEPLLQEYAGRSGARKIPSLSAEGNVSHRSVVEEAPRDKAARKQPESARPADEPAPAPKPPEDDLFSRAGAARQSAETPSVKPEPPAPTPEPEPAGEPSEAEMDRADAVSNEPSEPLLDLSWVGDGLRRTSDTLVAAGHALRESAGRGAVSVADRARQLKAAVAELKLSDSPVKLASALVVALFLIVVLVSILSRCTADRAPGTDIQPPAEHDLRVTVNPPAPYFD